MTPSELIDEKENFNLLEGKRHFIKNSFDFIIESVGVFDNVFLVTKACDILLSQLQTIEENIDTQNLKMNAGETLHSSLDCKFDTIDYSIGKLLEYGFYKNYFEGAKTLSFVNYHKPHPHDNASFLRIMFHDESKGKADFYAYFKNVVGGLKRDIEAVKEQF